MIITCIAMLVSYWHFYIVLLCKIYFMIDSSSRIILRWSPLTASIWLYMAPTLWFCPLAVRSQQSLALLLWLTTPLSPCRTPPALRWFRPILKQYCHLYPFVCLLPNRCCSNISNLGTLCYLEIPSACTAHQSRPLQWTRQFCWVALRRRIEDCSVSNCRTHSHHRYTVADWMW